MVASIRIPPPREGLDLIAAGLRRDDSIGG
jgi:hypothetical protein